MYVLISCFSARVLEALCGVWCHYVDFFLLGSRIVIFSRQQRFISNSKLGVFSSLLLQLRVRAVLWWRLKFHSTFESSLLLYYSVLHSVTDEPNRSRTGMTIYRCLVSAHVVFCYIFIEKQINRERGFTPWSCLYEVRRWLTMHSYSLIEGRGGGNQSN